MSGYFVDPDKVKGNDRAFLGNRRGRLLIPYLIWSAIYLVKSALFGGVSVKYVIYALVAGKAAAPFYYIIVLMQLTIITPWLIRNRKNYLYLLSPAYLVVLYGYNIVTGHTPLFYETLFPAWFFFYILGMDCRSGKLDRVIRMSNIGWIVIALCLSIVEAFGLLNLGCSDGFAVSQIKFSSFFYAAVIALWLQKKEKRVGQNILSAIGDYSYGIFYFHMLVVWVMSKVLRMVGLDKIWIVAFGITFIVVVCCSTITVGTTRRIIKNDKLLRAIGFE
jgi:peptidoglycan/LPS O-acetylase OafA/YrhL